MSEIFNRFDICSIINEDLKKQITIFHVFDDEKGFNVLFITSDDKVFGFGSNCYGFCGLGHNRAVNEPQIIPELCYKNIKHFFIGFTFILAQSFDNKVYGWGRNSLGQLGRGFSSGRTEYLKPEVISLLNESVIQISCGSGHTLVLTEEGNVYGFGYNEFGTIGCGKGKGLKITKPTKLEMFDKIGIKSIYCSYRRSFALTTDGLVYSWGYNEWCSLGHELDKNKCIFEPKLIDISNITSICLSSGNSYFLTNEGLIYFCGVFKGENIHDCHQKLPKLIDIKTKLHSLHYSNYFQKHRSIGSAISEDNQVFQLIRNNICEQKYKTLFEFYCCEYKITYKTVEIISDNYFDGNDSSDLKSLNKSLQKENSVDMFEVLEELGSGGFGVVNKVKNKNNDKLYALKTIPLEENNKENLEYLFREVNTLYRCCPYFVVKYFNSWIENNIFYIQMELCSDNLQNIITEKYEFFETSETKNSIDFFISYELFKEVLECVQYLHESKPPIMHRDLKPANIMVNYQPFNGRFVKLADFGLAKSITTSSKSNTRCVGTTSYIAPEVIGSTHYTTQCDIFSLGKIATELFDINREVSFGSYSALNNKWVHLRKLIVSMLNSDPTQRPTCFQILNFDYLTVTQKEFYILGRDALALFGNPCPQFLSIYLKAKVNSLQLKEDNNLN